MSSRCWDCGARIAKVHTSSGAQVSVDLEPSPDGTVVIDECGVAHVLSAKAAEALGGLRHTPHALTCTNPKSYH
jgi:hypothetical protein